MEIKLRTATTLAGIVATVTIIGIATSAAAQPGGRLMKSVLLGYEEVPAVSTTGTGEFLARISGNESSIDYTLSYQSLQGTTTAAAHIHLGQRGVNGGVIAFLCGGGGKPACPAVSGSVSGTITAADIIGPAAQGIAAGEFAELIDALRAGVTYVNVHTDKHPGGEIRGQNF
jgi:hypothetical protein